MDKTLAALIGAASALAVAAPAQAAITAPHDKEAALSASTYADLLQPVPNAKALLEASAPAEDAGFDPAAVETVQYHHHHHHHHRHWRRRWWHHHRPVVVIAPPG